MISPSTIHKIIKRFWGPREISALKGQGWNPTLNELWPLRQHCIKNCIKDSHNCKKDTMLAQKHFGETLSVNTVCCCIYKCRLRFYHPKRKTYINNIQKHCRLLWGPSSSEMDWRKVEKWAVVWRVSDCFHKSWTSCPPGERGKEPSRLPPAQSLKDSICDGIGVCVSHGIIDNYYIFEGPMNAER